MYYFKNNPLSHACFSMLYCATLLFTLTKNDYICSKVFDACFVYDWLKTHDPFLVCVCVCLRIPVVLLMLPSAQSTQS